jgi:hypothetical protein
VATIVVNEANVDNDPDVRYVQRLMPSSQIAAILRLSIPPTGESP